MEDWVTIRNLKRRNPSFGTRKIASILGISRNTVKRALKSEVYPSYNRAKKTYEKLSFFEEFIKESYLIKRQRISVIISNIRSKGYNGSDAAVYRYINDNIRNLSEELSSKSYQPYETAPGEQMQFDWSEYDVMFKDKKVKIYVHQLICGFSRKKIFNASIDITQSSIFTVLQESYSELKGVCKRIQVDNARQFVDNAAIKKLKWNQEFLNLCGYYGIKATRSLPYHPESKGKVESPFSYLEHHFIKNNTFESFEDFYDKLKRFQEEFNNRYHSKLQTTPNELFKKESEFLMELPSDNLLLFSSEIRKVTSDCLISYNGNRYSVPHYFSSKEVWIKNYKGLKVQIYSQKGQLITEHFIPEGRGNVIINKKHYKNYNNIYEQNSFDSLKYRFLERFSNFEYKEDFIISLKRQKGCNPQYQLMQILSIFDYYDDIDCISVMLECLKFNLYTYKFVKVLISDYGLKADVVSLKGANIPSKNVKRSMKEYELCR